MKLRNKKTGEIREAADVIIENMKKNGSTLNAISIDEVKEEWEDYKEPKEYWYIENDGYIDSHRWDGDDYDKRMMLIGNYFETKEEAEKAVEKLKAWKRLKDKGFRFDPVDRYEALCGNGFNIPITATMPPEAYTDVEVSKDLDICFGGEE